MAKVSDFLTMNGRELSRIEVVQAVIGKQRTQVEAARELGISVRHVKRLVAGFRVQGAQAIISKRRGRPSNHQLAPELKKRAQETVRRRYADFGPTLALEKLGKDHGIHLSLEALRGLMIEDGIWKAHRARKAVVHQMRERRECLGELIQIDGSPHAWFEERGAHCTLLVFIDDATGRFQHLQFAKSETTWSYMDALRGYLLAHGKPLTFYSDKNSIFHVNAKNALSGDGITHFTRSLKELDIELICANTPQAKGRVERANQTLQDRLVKELRLRGISDMDAANAFLPEYLAELNERFAVRPRLPHDSHRPLRRGDDLNRILTLRETRKLGKNLTLQYEKVIYQIKTKRPGYALRGACITVREHPNGRITLEYKGKSLDFEIFKCQEKGAKVMTSKEIATELPKPKPTVRRSAPLKPDHPWRKLRFNPKPTTICPR
jgi:transposase